MNKKILFPALVGLAFLVAVSTAQAATTTDNARPKVIPAIKNTSSTVGKIGIGAIARCPIVESKIQVKVTNFDNNKMKHVAVYAKLKTQLGVLADKLTARGVNVDQLRADLIVLDQKITKFNTDYAAYIAKLKDSQSYACGKSAGDFKAKLKDARTALQLVQKDVVDIRLYYVTTIKGDINKIRAALKGSATTTSVSSSAAVPATPAAPKTPKIPDLPAL